MSDNDDKAFFIDEYFKKWNKDIVKARELLDNPRYYLEGILVIACYIAALAAERYPTERDGERYVHLVLAYSGKREFYEQVDLLFLYQWPRSKLRDNGAYKELKNYAEIVKALENVCGTEDTLNASKRYVSPDTILKNVANIIPNFDEANFRDKISLFSLAELLYRYIRCDAVHNADFPFVNESVNAKGEITYLPNHVITHDVLCETVKKIAENLHADCVAKLLWPWELPAQM